MILYFHIGTHKTGTTTIQHILSQNNEIHVNNKEIALLKNIETNNKLAEEYFEEDKLFEHKIEKYKYSNNKLSIENILVLIVKIILSNHKNTSKELLEIVEYISQKV